ncbi:MAG: GGDEF domain-containing protein [Planctomycetota bacterium]|nr:GGDEF domain-containing protein [Planctomycetota bacterium]
MTDRSADKSLFSLAQIQHLMRVEFSRAQRYGYPISCLMIAVDRLGHLRDMYGYEAKEEIIDSLVGLLKNATRNSDFLGRMADDRLLAVVPHTGPTGIRSLSSRLVEQVHQLEFDSDGRRIPITVAIGGSYDGSDEGGEPADQRTMFFDALLQAAEEALDEAVAAGGDRVLFLTPAELGGAGGDS